MAWQEFSHSLDPLRTLSGAKASPSWTLDSFKQGEASDGFFDWSVTFGGMTTRGRTQRRGAGIVLTDGGQKE
jgi:hypothetical protein